MSEDAENWRNNDPFNLKATNNRTETPYEYYYGGFNTITGDTGGADGRDGRYCLAFPGAVE